MMNAHSEATGNVMMEDLDPTTTFANWAMTVKIAGRELLKVRMLMTMDNLKQQERPAQMSVNTRMMVIATMVDQQPITIFANMEQTAMIAIRDMANLQMPVM
jgi:hypothetical protein